MTTSTQGRVAALLVVCAAVGGVAAYATIQATSAPSAIAGDVRPITWTDLLPEGYEPDAMEGVPLSEADWLEAELSRMDDDGDLAPDPDLPAQSIAPAPTRAELDGQTVALAGYMTPLDVQGEQTSLFLLVPYVGACIHVPAPPPNQIVLVETAEPVPLLDMWEPFTAVGTMSVETVDAGLAQTGYVMSLDRMVALDMAGGPEGY